MIDAGAGDRVVWALRRAFHAVEADKEQRLRAVGMAPAHYAILINLVHSPGVTAAELARRLGVTPQNVAALVGKLASRGMLVRREHERHSHIRELHLTDAGRAAVHAADLQVTDLERDLVADLGADAAVLRELLERVARRPVPPLS